MSTAVSQTLLVTAAGLAFAVLVLTTARQGRLSLRYTLGWLGVSVCIVALVALTPLLRPVADSLGISPTGVLLAIASSLLLLITLQLSITVSSLQEAAQTLTESAGLLEERVHRLERDAARRLADER